MVNALLCPNIIYSIYQWESVPKVISVGYPRYEEIVGYKIQSNGTQRSVKTNQFFCDKYSQRKKVAGDQKDEGAAQVL